MPSLSPIFVAVSVALYWRYAQSTLRWEVQSSGIVLGLEMQSRLFDLQRFVNDGTMGLRLDYGIRKTQVHYMDRTIYKKHNLKITCSRPLTK